GATILTNRRVRMVTLSRSLLLLLRDCAVLGLPFTCSFQVLARLFSHGSRRLSRAERVLRQHLGDLDPASLLRRHDAGAHHRERARRILTADLRRRLAARRRRELLELLDEGIVAREWNRRRRIAATPEHAHAAVLVVERGRVLAIDV